MLIICLLLCIQFWINSKIHSVHKIALRENEIAIYSNGRTWEKASLCLWLISIHVTTIKRNYFPFLLQYIIMVWVTYLKTILLLKSQDNHPKENAPTQRRKDVLFLLSIILGLKKRIFLPSLFPMTRKVQKIFLIFWSLSNETRKYFQLWNCYTKRTKIKTCNRSGIML